MRRPSHAAPAGLTRPKADTGRMGRLSSVRGLPPRPVHSSRRAAATWRIARTIGRFDITPSIRRSHPVVRIPLGPRLDFTGALHHVIVRGIERRRIFRGDADRWLFLNRLADWVDSRAGLYAWALMPNHAHLLLRTGQLPLSCLMQAWLSAYSTTFNRRHRRLLRPVFYKRASPSIVPRAPTSPCCSSAER